MVPHSSFLRSTFRKAKAGCCLYNYRFMFSKLQNLFNWLYLLALVITVPPANAASGASWSGVLTDVAGKSVNGAIVEMHSSSGEHQYSAPTSADGRFCFTSVAAGSYRVSVMIGDKMYKTALPFEVPAHAAALTSSLQIASGEFLRVSPLSPELTNAVAQSASQASGGERLSSAEVSSLPLNARDFSKLLLLAAGTMTDSNGAANFTQQFAVNGQRGSATVFALDGADTTDPEMGGATFSNFNVDAIQEVQSSSGVMAAEIGHGAACYTNVITRFGTNDVHGSIFEFVRNAAFDARNYFDHVDLNGRRIPPFARNEFGFTNGGPI